MVKKNTYFIFFGLVLLLFSGCSSLNVDDGVIRAEDGTPLIVDDYQLKVINTPNEHEAVHDHRAFRTWYTITIPGNDYRTIQLDTGLKNLHFKERDIVISNNNGEVFYSVFVDSNITTNGTTEVDVFNSNTNYIYSDNSTTKIYLDPVVSSRGPMTDSVMIPTTGKTGGSNLDSFEWIYKANTTIIVDINNTGSQEIFVNIRYKWYNADGETH